MGNTTSALPWPEWIIDRYIGKSENSAFFQVHHEETKEYASIERKDIYLPDDFEAQLMSQGGSVKDYSDIYLGEAIKRIQIAQQLAEVPGMVGINEYQATPNVRAGYTMFIRRKYALSLADYLEKNTLTLPEYVQGVTELCDALTACHEHSIIYNGTRKESIYLTADGHFCLGTDYFFALRNMGETINRFYMEGLTDTGAPETVNSGVCSPVSDVYTLGMLLYCIFNEGNIPFLPLKKKKTDIIYQGAVERRLRGEKLHAPANGTPEMAEVILKACQFKPENRYQSVAELKAELVRLLENNLVIPTSNEDDDDDVDDSLATSDYLAEKEAREKLEKYQQQLYNSTYIESKISDEEYNKHVEAYRKRKSNKPLIVRIIALLLFLMFLVVQLLNSGLFQRNAGVPKDQQTETEAQQVESEQAETEAQE